MPLSEKLSTERVTRLAILVLDERFLVGVRRTQTTQKCPALVPSVVIKDNGRPPDEGARVAKGLITCGG
jgi:hypothetical protein